MQSKFVKVWTGLQVSTEAEAVAVGAAPAAAARPLPHPLVSRPPKRARSKVPAASSSKAPASSSSAGTNHGGGAAPAAAGIGAADPLPTIPTHDHTGGRLSDYERQRLANIASNTRVLEAPTLAMARP